jgi:hypothetical protein
MVTLNELAMWGLYIPLLEHDYQAQREVTELRFAEFSDQNMGLLQSDLALGPSSCLRTSDHRIVRNAEQGGGMVCSPTIGF